MCLTKKEIDYFKDQLPRSLHVVEKPLYTFLEDERNLGEYRVTFFHKDVIMRSASLATLENWIEFLELNCSVDDLHVITQSELSHS